MLVHLDTSQKSASEIIQGIQIEVGQAWWPSMVSALVTKASSLVLSPSVRVTLCCVLEQKTHNSHSSSLH